MNEFELIKKYFTPISCGESQFLKNDGAVFKPKINRDYVVSTDTLLESIHFKGDEKPQLIAKKALRTNLSDLAAMGAKPEFYSLSLSLPKLNSTKFIRLFADGLASDQNYYKIKLLGGDLTASPKLISITISIIGSVPSGKSISRSGSKINDDLYVTGTLGLSNIGLLYYLKKNKQFYEAKSRYLLPQPRLKFSSTISKYVTSMIDISDGFLQDCSHLAEASNLEFVLNLEKIPISEIDCLTYDQKLNSALTGGDDYELIFTLPKIHEKKIQKIANNQNLKLTNVGYVKNGKNGKVTSKNKILRTNSYVHF